MRAFFEWAARHPEATWMIVTALLTTLFAPRTPEQLAVMPKWLASFFHIVSSLGVDVPKLISVVRYGPKRTPVSMAPPPPPAEEAPKESDPNA